MNDSENSIGRRIKMILGTLGIFVVFGFLALILSGFAGSESPEDRAYKGEFSEETTEMRWKNLKEVEAAQSELFDETNVEEAMKTVMSKVSEPSKTDIVVPGSPTFLEQSQQQAAPADAEETPPAPEEAKAEKEGSKDASPGIKPGAPGAAAPEEETPKPGSVNAPESKAKPKGDAKAKPEADAKAKSKAKPKSEAPKGDAPKGDAPKGDAPKGDAAEKAEGSEKPAPANQ